MELNQNKILEGELLFASIEVHQMGVRERVYGNTR